LAVNPVASSFPSPTPAVAPALNQGLTSFLMDQATTSYTASQLLGGGSSIVSLGSTTA
jgi:hypothetical protein